MQMNVEIDVRSVLPAIRVPTLLATVLFTDIVDSTRRASEQGDRRWRETLDAHHALVRDELGRFRGREIDTAGGGFLAAFDGPARGVRAACAISSDVKKLGLEVRAGLHTGGSALMLTLAEDRP
jgi:class 3 adenylate cyclase